MFGKNFMFSEMPNWRITVNVIIQSDGGDKFKATTFKSQCERVKFNLQNILVVF